MVDAQIAARGVTDPAVLAAMRAIPREAFVDASLAAEAYEDAPLPIGAGQTISQPFIVACMAEAARINPDDSVLEIGTGSGYGAAVLGSLARKVVTVERLPELAQRARRRLAALGQGNVLVVTGDGTLGHAAGAPYDAIIVAAGAPDSPPALAAQLAIGGRLVIPVGRSRRSQQLLRITRTAEDRFDEEDLGAVAFVPLIGAAGWQAP